MNYLILIDYPIQNIPSPTLQWLAHQFLFLGDMVIDCMIHVAKQNPKVFIPKTNIERVGDKIVQDGKVNASCAGDCHRRVCISTLAPVIHHSRGVVPHLPVVNQKPEHTMLSQSTYQYEDIDFRVAPIASEAPGCLHYARSPSDDEFGYYPHPLAQHHYQSHLSYRIH